MAKIDNFVLPPDFKRLMTARFFYTLGTQIQAIVLGWQMYVLTKDPLYLGLIGLAEAIPALSLSLYAGYIVDRSRPLVVLRRFLDINLVSALLLLLTELPYLGLKVPTQITFLFVSSFLTGAARAFSQPTMFSLVPRLVPREALPKSSAWMSTSMQVARISGPAIGGILFGWVGMSTTAFVVLLCTLIAIGATYLVETSPEAMPRFGNRRPIKEELLSGFRFVYRHPILFPALSLDMVSVLFGGVTALLPVFAAEVLMIGPKGLGALRAAPAVGAAITAFWLTSKDIRKKAGIWFFTAVGGFGVCILVFSLSHNFALSLAALGLSGAFDSVSMVVRGAAVQLSSPESMRGRIAAVNSIFIGSSNELGEFESGVAAKFLGAQPAAIMGGIFCIISVIVAAVICPPLRSLNLEELGVAEEV